MPALAEVWVVEVKDGMDRQFREAYKKHLAYRKKQNDPRAWQTYVPVIGDDLDHYGIRYCCFDYADLDSYVDWTREAKTADHWNENVDQYVESYRHYLQTLDHANNNWPEDTPQYTLFGVTRYDQKMGASAAVEASKTALSEAAKEGGWPRHWSWVRNTGGSNGLELIVPYENYKSMAPTQESFAEFLARNHGSDKARELLADFTDNFDGATYTVYRHVPDLSMGE